MISSVIAHECGHIACRHYLYHSLARNSANGIAQSPLSKIPGVRKYISKSLVTALLFWDRCSELSADRAAVLCDGSSDKTVDITRGNRYSYSDYGLGSYVTFSYTVKFGDVKATAYCVQPSRGSPGDGTFTITKLKDGKALAKVCYYGTKSSGNEGFFAEKHPDFSAGKRFVITHIAAAYANGSSDAFSGTNETGKKLAMELYEYCQSMPNIPDVDMAFSEDTLQAYVEGSSQRTKVVTFDADELQTITFKLPDGVKLHNETTGKTSKAGAEVEINGGTKFYFSAPLTQATDVSLTWHAKMKGSVTKDYSAYKITTGDSTQDLALVFGIGGCMAGAAWYLRKKDEKDQNLD